MRARAISTEVHHAEKVHYAGTADLIESNAVPDRRYSLTVYESVPFRGSVGSAPPALLGPAQNLIRSIQKRGKTDSRHIRAYRAGRPTVFRCPKERPVDRSAPPRCVMSRPPVRVRGIRAAAPKPQQARSPPARHGWAMP